MKKFITRAGILMLMVLMANCASFNESLQARKLLANCKYEIKEIRLKAFDFSPIISFDKSGKKINIEEVKITEILLLLDQIRNGEFSFSLKELQFDVLVEVENPNAKEVIMDSVELKLLLDESFLLDLNHGKNLNIPAQSKAVSTIACNLPLNFPLNKLMNAKEFTLDGNAFMKVNFTKRYSKEIEVPLKITRDIPSDQINAALEEQKGKILQALLDKTKRNPQMQKVKDALNIIGF